MEHYYAELVGVAAAAASLYAAHAKTMIPLRVAAIAANFLAMIYSFMHGTYPTFLLNVALLPLNGVRLHTMIKLVRDIDVATKSDMNVDWLLPYTRPQAFKAGDILMARGDYATAAYYVIAGEVEIVELGEVFGKGTFLGEIGLFTPRRQAHGDGALQDRRANREDRLRSVQAAVFPESAIRIPPAPPDRRAHAAQPRASRLRHHDVARISVR